MTLNEAAAIPLDVPCEDCGHPGKHCGGAFEVRKHAPKDVTENRDGSYSCGICGREVVRYSTPRAVWKHA